MVHRRIHTVLSTLLLAVSLPFLAFSVLRSACRRRKADDPVRPPDSIGEFDFEHAIPAYEALIDQTVAERRQ